MKRPRYEYQCATCGGEVTKYKPCGEILGRAKQGREEVRAGLHGWECKRDGRGVSVKRNLKGKQ